VPQLDLPAPLSDGFLQIASFGDDRFRKLVTAFAQLPQRFNQQSVTRQIASAVGLSHEHAEQCAQAVTVAAGQDASVRDRLFSDIAETLHAANPKLDSKRVIRRLLELSKQKLAIGLARSMRVTFENERTFRTAMTISEMRPVFGDSLDSGPLASVIVHSLKLTFSTAGEPDLKQFSVVLDDRDLSALITALERAKVKSKAIQTLTDRIELPLFDVTVE